MAETTGRGKRRRAPSLAIETNLYALLQSQAESITAVQGWLDGHQVAAAPNCEEITAKIREHLATHNGMVVDAKQTHAWPTSSPSCWGPVRCIRADGDGLVFSITGPAQGDRFEITAASAAETASLERFVSCFSEMAEHLASGEAQIKRLIQISSELEGLKLSGPPQATVQTHINLLQQYNDMKDIGQQLIGLVAENKGVPIGSLYQSRQYGVGPED